MPPWAGYWHGVDVDLRREFDLIDEETCETEQEDRQSWCVWLSRILADRGLVNGPEASPDEVRDAVLRLMAEGETPYLLVNLEDLWLERQPQNLPGIANGYPSWRHRAARTLAAIRDDGRINELLADLAGAMAGRSAPTPAEHSHAP